MINVPNAKRKERKKETIMKKIIINLTDRKKRLEEIIKLSSMQILFKINCVIKIGKLKSLWLNYLEKCSNRACIAPINQLKLTGRNEI